LALYFQIAAFIAEPVMGAGGVIPPPKTYFEKVMSFSQNPFFLSNFPQSLNFLFFNVNMG
jgi:hypothetical protein